jgi:hypothetical protein
MADAETSQVRGGIYEFCFGKMHTSIFIILKEKPAVAGQFSFHLGKTKCLIVVSMP